MGVQESKPARYGSTPNLSSSGSLRRSSLYKSTTLDQIQVKHELVRSIQSDIDIFAGSRADDRYKELQQILTKTSSDLNQIKQKSNKDRTRDRCDQVLKEVNASIVKLETKLALNEQSERGLDLAAVESDSFVHQTFSKPSLANPASLKPLVRNLDDIELQLQNLEKEVEVAVSLEDTKQFIILEKKITILYGDLVMVQIDDNTPLSERRELFERRLINCNNQIKKCKRRLTKRLSEPAPRATSRNETENDVDSTQKHVYELEKEALAFKGTKSDQRYKELEQILERYWTKLYSMDLFTDDERQKKDQTVEKIKEVLQGLRKSAEENERQIKSIQKLADIEEQIVVLTKETGEFFGNSNDSEYTRLDQDLRRLWANLNDIEDINEHVVRNKIIAVTNLKNLLKELLQKTAKRDNQISEDSKKTQLLKQVEEFQNHWNHLNRTLNEQPISDSNIIEMLEAVLDGLKKKTTTLTVLENRKSNASLVVAKMTDSTDLYEKYKSAPDLVPQQLGIPEVDSKIAPLNKTKVIAEMHRIGNDVKTILQQIKEDQNVKDEDKKAYEDKLNNHKTNLNALVYNKKSDTIESNRRRVTKLIEEAFKALEQKFSNEQTRSSAVHEIMDINAEIQFWRQQIRNFSGTDKDKHYEKIKNGLAESLIHLQVLGDKHVSKQESIQQIQQHHQELETKLAENQAKIKCAEIKHQISLDIKATVEQVQKLKAQVDRFSGTYNGILYKQIENNLKICSAKLDTIEYKNDERLNNAKLQTQQKIAKYLTILEEKASKPSKLNELSVNKAADLQKLQETNILKETPTYQRVYSENVEKEKPQQIQTTSGTELPHHKINAIRESLVTMKDKVEEFSGRYNDLEYIAIKKELSTALYKLKSIDDSGHESVSLSKIQYIDYIEKLQKYFEDKTIASGAQTLHEDEV